jgi:hypothetical protein
MLESLRYSVRRGAKLLRKAGHLIQKRGRRLSKTAKERQEKRQAGRGIRRFLTNGAHAQLRRPDFVILGAPKCGTSWLAAVLRRHPQVLVVPEEIEYFSSYLDRPLDWYLSRFSDMSWVKPDFGVKDLAACKMGEKSASYCRLPLARIKLIRDLLPDARLILMVRDPVSRHWAHAKQFFWKRGVRSGQYTFETLPRKTLFRFLQRTRPLGEFSTMIANWSSVFSPDSLLVMAQERALASPQAAFDAALAHIGVSTEYDPDSIDLLTKQVNRGPSVSMPEDVERFLTDMFAEERPKFQKFLSRQGLGRASEGTYPA